MLDCIKEMRNTPSEEIYISVKDGCKLFGRFYHIKEGAPEYLIDQNDIEYFFAVVEKMRDAANWWNPPPIIIEFKADESFYVCDGRHRLEMYRQQKAKSIPAIVWATGKDSITRLQEIIKSMDS